MFWSSSKRKNKERLLRQWVEHGDLSPEQAQSDLLADELGEKSKLGDDEIRSKKMRDYAMLLDTDRTINLPIRYMVILLSIIAVLIIVLSVVLTVLIMWS